MSKSIILVEDDFFVVQPLLKRLESEGYAVVPVPDGNSAVEVAREHPPALFLLDINLPFKNGIEVADSVRDFCPDTPIVFMTAARDDAYRINCKRIPRSWFLEKPFTTPFLLSTIRTALADTAF